MATTTNRELDQIIASLDDGEPLSERNLKIVGLLEELRDRRQGDQSMRRFIKSRATVLLDSLDRLGDDDMIDDLFF